MSTRRGERCPSQLIGSAGNRGSNTKASADSSKPSCNSASLSQSVAKRCRRAFRASTPASTTANAAASSGCVTDSIPMSVVTIKANSVVKPGSSDRERQ